MLSAADRSRPSNPAVFAKKSAAIELMLLNAVCATSSRPVAPSMFDCQAAACVACGRRSSDTFAPAPRPA